MTASVGGLASALALLAVGTMGFAIQRGGTCTVAAMDEVVNQRRATRLTAMLEASLWVAGGLLLAQLVGLAGSMPGGWRITFWTVAGGVLLGWGAFVNRACVFGAIARLGSGDWAQALTPLGFFAGAWAAAALASAWAGPTATVSASASPLWAAAAWLGPLFLAYAAWRAGPGLRELWRGRRAAVREAGRPGGPGEAVGPGGAVGSAGEGRTSLAARVWQPHAATIVIGITFVITLLLAGRWAYTDVLADLAHGMARGGWMGLALPLALLVALYAGALIGGWTAGRWRGTAPTAASVMRALLGGTLMGLGSLLIPGSNDGLLLIGLPLLQPHAWLAFTVMCTAIAAALVQKRRMQSRSAARNSAGQSAGGSAGESPAAHHG